MKKYCVKNLISHILLIIISLSSNAQKIAYSEKEIDAYTTNYQVIGQIKDHIIIWTIPKKFPAKSELYIYDDQMRFIKTVKLHVLKPTGFYKTHFINNRDSFQLVYQYENGKKQATERISFDQNGKLLHKELIAHDWLFEFISSQDEKYFALTKSIIDTITNTLRIEYIYFQNTSNSIHSATAILPFNPASSIGPVIIDKNDNLIVTLINSKNDFIITVFKINLVTNNIINSIRELQTGFLLTRSIMLSDYLNGYAIAAAWQHQKNNGIFLWRLNDDLSDIVADTIIEQASDFYYLKTRMWLYNNKNKNAKGENLGLFINIVKIDSASKPYDSITIAQSIYNSDLMNSLNFDSPSQGNFFSKPLNYFNSTTNLMPSEYYTRYFDNLHDFRSLNYPNTNNYLWGSNSMYDSKNTQQTLNNKNNSGQYQFFTSNKPADHILSFLQLDKTNKVIDSLNFNGVIDSSVISNISQSEIFKSGYNYNIIFPQNIHDQQVLGHIKILPNNTFVYDQIFLIQLNHKILFRNGVQLNDNTVIFPCVKDNKIEFVKIMFN